MYGSKKKKKKNIIIVISIIVVTIIILAYSFLSHRHLSFVEKGFKDVFIMVQKAAMYPFTTLNAQKQVDQSDSYLIQKNVNRSLEKEIQELKDALDLNKTFTEYDVVNATVLSRNRSYWFNNLTIDKGSQDGIKNDMAVVTNDGLVGKTTKVTNHSSEVKLITSDDLNYKISVSISVGEKDTYAILNGYDQKTGTVKVTGVDKDSEVKVDDVVLTSGFGSLFPRGIYVGVVSKVTSDKYNLSKTLYIKTTQDFNHVHYVTVLKEKK